MYWNYFLMQLLFLVLYVFYWDDERSERYVMLGGLGLVGTITVVDFQQGYLSLAGLLAVMATVYIAGQLR